MNYYFPLQLIPLFHSDFGGRIYPLVKHTLEWPPDQPLLQRMEEVICNIGPETFDLNSIQSFKEDFRRNAFSLNEDYRKIHNLQTGYTFNNFLVEGKVLYLLGEDQLTISREAIFKIKPEDIELSHSVKFDSSLMLKALECLSKIYSKGLALNENVMKSEMNMSDLVWKTFSRDIMELVKGVPDYQRNAVSDQKMIILVGVPGSGKSTLAHKMVKLNTNWVRVNQDDLKTRKACEVLARDSLKKGKSVIIDRCNFDIQQRNVWVKIASEFGVTDIRCVQFKVPIEVCKQRIVVREDHPTIPKGDSGIKIIDNFSGILVNPSPWEGFTEILSAQNEKEIDLILDKLSPLATLCSPTTNSNAREKKPRGKGKDSTEVSNSTVLPEKNQSSGKWGSLFSHLDDQ